MLLMNVADLSEDDMTTESKAIEIHGLGRDAALRRRIEAQVGEVLERVGLTPVSALVAFVDDNGPKGGPALRCALTMTLPYRPALHVEHSAETPRLAFDGAFAALERQVERYRRKDRDSRRHPKKYYAARQLVEAPSAPPAKPPRAARSRKG
jgi:ribosome-associated translation inhibitor RaiA